MILCAVSQTLRTPPARWTGSTWRRFGNLPKRSRSAGFPWAWHRLRWARRSAPPRGRRTASLPSAGKSKHPCWTAGHRQLHYFRLLQPNSVKWKPRWQLPSIFHILGSIIKINNCLLRPWQMKLSPPIFLSFPSHPPTRQPRFTYAKYIQGYYTKHLKHLIITEAFCLLLRLNMREPDGNLLLIRRPCFAGAARTV